VLDAALIRTLPFRAPERLIRVDQVQLDHQGRNFGYSWPGLRTPTTSRPCGSATGRR
jgi:hypothetical protein